MHSALKTAIFKAVKWILSALFFFTVADCFAQTAPIIVRSDEEKGTIFSREAAGNIRVMGNGYALSAQFGDIVKYYQTTYYEFEIAYLKHPREHVQSSNLFTGNGFSRPSNSYAFGKQNSFYTLHAAYGNRRYLSDKEERKGVAVAYFWAVGPSLGLIKPYHLRVQSGIDAQGAAIQEEIAYSEENRSLFLDVNRIYGTAGLKKGWDKLALAPGGRVKGGLHFDWGILNKNVVALEAGLMVDLYFRQIPIMLTEDNHPYFVNFFVNLQFGKRW